MNHAFDIKLDAKIMEASGRRLYGLKTWWKFFLYNILLVVLGFYLSYFCGMKYIFPFFNGFVTAFFLVYIAAVCTARKNTFDLLKKYPIIEIKYEMDDNLIKASSNIGKNEYGWQRVTRLRTFQDLWFLYLDNGLCNTIPVAQVSPEILEFIKGRVISVGGKVK